MITGDSPWRVDFHLHAAAAMAYREFVDSQGREWRVWSTVPSAPRALTSGFERGWLTFESGHELRRHAPIPEGWSELSVQRLELLCRSATPATTRHTPPRGLPRAPDSGGLR